MPKYKKTRPATLADELYHDLLKNRGLERVVIRRTVVFDSLKKVKLRVMETHVWAHGDSLHKLSLLYYGDPQYWWVIGMINRKPTDAHYSFGDEVIIPGSPDIIKNSIGADS